MTPLRPTILVKITRPNTGDKRYSVNNPQHGSIHQLWVLLNGLRCMTKSPVQRLFQGLHEKVTAYRIDIEIVKHKSNLYTYKHMPTKWFEGECMLGLRYRNRSFERFSK